MLLHQIKDMEDPAAAAADVTDGMEAKLQEDEFQKEKDAAEKEALAAAQQGSAEVHAP